jgi:hypothetical protein
MYIYVCIFIYLFIYLHLFYFCLYELYKNVIFIVNVQSIKYLVSINYLNPRSRIREPILRINPSKTPKTTNKNGGHKILYSYISLFVFSFSMASMFFWICLSKMLKCFGPNNWKPKPNLVSEEETSYYWGKFDGTCKLHRYLRTRRRMFCEK